MIAAIGNDSKAGRAARRLVWGWTVLVLLPTGGSVWAQQAPSPVGVAEVIQEAVLTEKTLVGTVLPRRKTTVGSAVDGRVLDFQVSEGDWVRAGETLAQLRTKDLEIELDGARAELELRTQELAELENGSLPEEIAQAKAALEGARAVMEYAKGRSKRSQSLFQQGKTISLEELEEAVSNGISAEQTYLAAQAAYDLAVQGPRAERIGQARARVQVQQELINQIEDRIDKFTVRVPFDGYVVHEYTEAQMGAWLSRGDPVADVIEMDPAEVRVPVPERYIGSLQQDMTVQVRVESLPGREFPGRIARIVPQGDVRSRTFPVRIWLDNPRQGGGHLLKAGMLAHVTVSVGTTDALLVPKDALVLGGSSPVVYVVEPGSANQPATVRRVSVQMGVSRDADVQVIGDLQAGQQVVVRGNERLRPGQAVRALP